MALPPLLAGAVHVTNICPSPAVISGRPVIVGTVRGVDDDDVDEFALLPAAFFANTRNMYAVPFVRPVTVTEVAVEVVPLAHAVHVDPLFDEYSRS
jgi:hypothetical protein